MHANSIALETSRRSTRIYYDLSFRNHKHYVIVSPEVFSEEISESRRRDSVSSVSSFWRVYSTYCCPGREKKTDVCIRNTIRVLVVGLFHFTRHDSVYSTGELIPVPTCIIHHLKLIWHLKLIAAYNSSSLRLYWQFNVWRWSGSFGEKFCLCLQILV